MTTQDDGQFVSFEALFPTLDMKGAVERMGGMTMIVYKVVKSFHEQYKDTAVKDAKALLDAGNYTDAGRHAHTLKGLAGSIGAVKLQEACLNLEKACKSDNPSAVKEEAFAVFAREMDAAIAEMGAGLSKFPNLEELIKSKK